MTYWDRSVFIVLSSVRRSTQSSREPSFSCIPQRAVRTPHSSSLSVNSLLALCHPEGGLMARVGWVGLDTKKVIIHHVQQDKHIDRVSLKASRYLYDGLGELQPAAQHAVQLVPLVLQGAQLRLQLGLALLVPHGEELAAHLQSVDEAALMPLEQQLRAVLGRPGGGEEPLRLRQEAAQLPQAVAVQVPALHQPLHQGAPLLGPLHRALPLLPQPGELQEEKGPGDKSTQQLQSLGDDGVKDQVTAGQLGLEPLRAPAGQGSRELEPLTSSTSSSSILCRKLIQLSHCCWKLCCLRASACRSLHRHHNNNNNNNNNKRCLLGSGGGGGPALIEAPQSACGAVPERQDAALLVEHGQVSRRTAELQEAGLGT
ncbi:hypothetical protein EYF80_049951 [Liparis tanakae]|uniref:Uncharacterized protein n=1 Tax=Liparis tanakae TaxID=230148 RepID=A0A4Z2FFC6_9TELE|nr:hypothetical protein EYF80_049951 [Liparis tanakae]